MFSLSRSWIALMLTALVQSLPAQQKVTTTASSVVINTPQFLWFTSQNALRFGTVSNAWTWGSAQIGGYSLAFGADALAPSTESFAFGSGAQASATASFAFGPYAYTASTSPYYVGTFAFGDSTYAENSSIAIGNAAYATGGGVAIGLGSSAASGALQLGSWGAATDYGAISLGESWAYAPYAFTAVYNSAAYGFGSIAIGVESWAHGDYSVSLGAGANAQAWGGIALGMGNVAKRKDGSAISPEAPAASDPIFEVARADPALGINPVYGLPVERGENALTIYRDGQAHFAGVVRVRPGGDVGMGNFKTKPAGVVFVGE